MAIAALDASSEEAVDEDEEEFTNIIKMAKNKKRIAKPNVIQEMTFSEPLSLVLAKTFKPPPVIAPEAPSDLPP